MKNYALAFSIMFILIAGCITSGPQGLKAVPTAGGIQLAWSPGSGASGYDIYKSTVDISPGLKINSGLVVQPSYMDRTVLDGVTYYYTVKAISSSGEELGFATANATAKVAPPQNLMILVAGGKNITSQRSVSLSLYADGANECRFSNDGAVWSDWEPYSSSKNWELTVAAGEKQVYYQCRDQVGNLAGAVSTSVRYDNSPPQITLITPAAGAQYNGGFNLAFNISNQVAGTISCTGTLDGNSLNIGTVEINKVYNVSMQASPGSHTVAVQCTDGLQTVAATSSFAILQSPEVSIRAGDGSGYTSAIAITLGVDSKLASECRFSNNGINWNSWSSYSPTVEWSLATGDGAKSIYAQCRDSAGLLSEVAQTSIVLDTSPPPYIILRINSGAEWVNSQSVVLGTYAFSAAKCRYSNDGFSWTDYEPYVTSRAWVLTSEEGQKTVYYNCANNQGTDLGITQATIMYSYKQPNPPSDLSLIINQGDSITNSRLAVLRLSALNANSCRFKEEGYNWTAWEGYASRKEFTLSRDSGTKVVYYQCMNDFGQGNTYGSIYLDISPPSPVGDLSGQANESSVYLTWSKQPSSGSGVSRYDVYRSAQSTSLFTKIGSPSSPPYTDSPVVYGEVYSYYVVAVDSIGQQSGMSNIFEVSIGEP